MTRELVERRLTAILAADVAGYSRLMGADEEGTLSQLKGHRRALVDPKIKEHHGRIVKTTGDGALVEFASVVDAVRCAVEIQRGMAERNAEVPENNRIEFRIGVNVGDVIIDDGDIFGDGVNVAARLEGLAEPGGVCVSMRVQEDTEGKLDFAFEDVGEQRFKNIARPVRAFRVRLNGELPSVLPTLALPNKPSIAVLPFNNMSGDPEQEYFADGVVEDIITALSRFKSLFVIARNSSFTYKGRAVDVKHVGRELGVRYVLEGSVRKAGNRVRIAGQLIDAATGGHLWAENFDSLLENIFDLQDQVTGRVVNAIAPKVEQAELERTKHSPTESLDSYDCYLRAMAKAHWEDEDGNSEALRLFYEAIKRDPDFAAAYGMASWCFVWRKSNGWVAEPVHEIAEAMRLARRAAELGKDDAIALSRAGFSIAYLTGDVDGGSRLIDRALVLNPNLASAWYFSGWVRVWAGEPELAIAHLGHAMRLSPLDQILSLMHTALAFAHFLCGHYEEASSWAKEALRANPNLLSGLRIAAASIALAGRLEEAQQIVSRLSQLNPSSRLSNIRDVTPLREPKDLARYMDALRRAGLRE